MPGTTRDPVRPIRAQRDDEDALGSRYLAPNGESMVCRGVHIIDEIEDYQNTIFNVVNNPNPIYQWPMGISCESYSLIGGLLYPGLKLLLKDKDVGTVTLRQLYREKVSRADVKKTLGINCQSGAATGFGVANPTVLGLAGTSDNTDAATFSKYSSDAISASGGIRSTFDIVRRKHDPTFVAVIKTGANISNVRLWVGLGSAAPTNDAGPAEYVAFRYAPGAGDTGWVGSAKSATGGTLSTGVVNAIAINTVYTLLLRIDSTAQKVYFSINGGSIAIPEVMLDISTLGGASLDMGMFCMAVSDDLLNARTISVSRLYQESK